jgi:hypothetical protein
MQSQFAGWHTNTRGPNLLFDKLGEVLHFLLGNMARVTQPKASINHQGSPIYIFACKPDY